MSNVLPREKRLRVLAALVDGNSIRATERMADVSAKTIGKLGLALGEGAVRLHNRLVRGLSCSLVELDELWSWCHTKPHRVPDDETSAIGSAWSWVALDRTSRLAISFHVGKRNQESADILIKDLRSRLAVMPQLMTSDGLSHYVAPIALQFGYAVTYAQCIKDYSSKGHSGPDHRYEPARDPFITKKAIFGAPDMDLASTSKIERNNGTMRHVTGRLRRLCLAFSKKLENHKAAISLAYTYYNFCWIVSTIRVTPAMAAGVSDHVWPLEELLDVLLSEPPCEAPAAQRLVLPVPEGPARELPNGRGFIRLLQGGGAPPAAPTPAPASPPPAQVAAVGSAALAAPPDAPATTADGQLDLLSWRPKPKGPKQLSLFGDDPEGAGV